MTNDLDLAAHLDAAATEQLTEADLKVIGEDNAEATDAEHRRAAAESAYNAMVTRHAMDMAARQAAADKLSALARGAVGVVYETVEELMKGAGDGVDFMVPRLLIRGGTSLGVGSPKDGKSVQAVVGIIGPGERGEDTVFGPTPEPFTTLIVSEEPRSLLAQKIDAAGIERAGYIDSSRLAGLAWDDKCDVIIGEALDHGHDVIFNDNLRRLAGASAAQENSSDLGWMVETFADKVRAANLTLFGLHHMRKMEGSVMERVRGGTALPGACDMLLALERVSDDVTDRRRRLTGWGRPSDSNFVVGIELSEDGRSYALAEVPNARNGEISRQQNRRDKLTGDLMRLREFGQPITAATFADGQTYAAQAAANRLNALVGEGLAVRDESSTPYTWTPAESV